MPNYTALPTICPQCNSDLKPFLLLHDISKTNLLKANKLIVIGFVLVASILSAIYFNSISGLKRAAYDNSISFIQLQDSIKTLQSIIAKNQSELATKEAVEKESVIQYIVKKGDYTSKIAQFFYNDFRMYKKIESDNNLKHPYILQVGQKLKIKIKSI